MHDNPLRQLSSVRRGEANNMKVEGDATRQLEEERMGWDGVLPESTKVLADS